MLYEALAREIMLEFPHRPTAGQAEAVARLAQFATMPGEGIFILRGYAGTGKTTLIGALVRTLKRLDRPTLLLAPTGRAAKVFSRHSASPAYTVHRAIYRQQTFRGEDTPFHLGFNPQPDTFFIVDEASMLTDQPDSGSPFGSGCLLDDLVQYCFSRQDCKLLLVGDTAQLPPVGSEESPALNPSVMRRYVAHVAECDLTEVVRQTQGSDVLAGATRLRQLLAEGADEPPRIDADDEGEVRHVSGAELIEVLDDAYSEEGTDETIVITRSNKQATAYNFGIRARIFDREEELCSGDLVMCVKNNYYWTARHAAELEKGKTMPISFIANGDTCRVVCLSNVHEMHGFHFADATLAFPDYGNYELTCRVLLDTLASETAALTPQQSTTLYESVLADYAHIASRAERFKQMRQDPYYNALQLKYAYAVTCHKAQGGQWRRVFIDQGYLPPDASLRGYLRWLYTAFTRSADRLYLINWPAKQRYED